jgi:hypothetical protein
MEPTADAHQLAKSSGLRTIATGAWLAVALVLFALSTKTAADPDLWGHLRFGLDTLSTRTLPGLDPYSFTQDRPWINHEWFSEWQMGAAYRAAGIGGLALLKGALVFFSLWMIWSSLKGVDPIARMSALGLVVLGTGSITSTLRPQLWSLALLCILCRTLARDHRRGVWLLPIAFVVWANVHGGWVVGLGVVGAWATAGAWTDRRRTVEWAGLFAACAAATLVTPYGTTLWRFIWETVGVTRPISEWQPLFRVPPMNWMPVVATMIAAAWLLATRPFEHRLQAALVLAMLAYGAVRVSRIGPLFVASASILLAPAIRSRWPMPRLAALPSGAPAVVLVSVLMLLSVAGSAWIGRTTLTCIDVSGSWTAPANGAQLLAGRRGRLVTLYDWGQYALWHLGPDLRVSMDGRRETVYSDVRIAEHDAIVTGEARGFEMLDLWRAEFVWLPATSVATKTWLAAHGYRIELDDEDSFVAVRADLPPLPIPLESDKPGERCFPH